MLTRIKRAIRGFVRPVKLARVACPLCGRNVAVTNNGLTFYHRVAPGTTNTKHHAVRLSDGVEIR